MEGPSRTCKQGREARKRGGPQVVQTDHGCMLALLFAAADAVAAAAAAAAAALAHPYIRERTRGETQVG